jgi:hypothetical protein
MKGLCAQQFAKHYCLLYVYMHMCNLKLTIALSTCCGCANSSLVASSHTVLVLLVKLGLLSEQKYCAGMLLHVDKDKLHGNTYMQML